jgi:hypothetical protein
VKTINGRQGITGQHGTALLPGWERATEVFEMDWEAKVAI